MSKAHDCRTCDYAIKEYWASNVIATKCEHKLAGKWKGRVVGTPRKADLPIVPIAPPVWCPKQ